MTMRPCRTTALAPFLGGLTREVFCRAFGLDAEALRASGKDLQKSDGELGSALFSAASGLRGLNDLRAALDKEADGIFAQRASKDRTFYQGLNRYEDARAALREREFRSGALKKLRDGIEEQSRAHEATRARRARDRDGEVPPRAHQAVRAHRPADRRGRGGSCRAGPAPGRARGLLRRALGGAGGAGGMPRAQRNGDPRRSAAPRRPVRPRP